MAKFKSKRFDHFSLAPHSAGEVMAMDDIVDFPATLASGDIAVVGYLPLACQPVDAIVYTDRLDTGGTPKLKFAVGILNDEGTDLIPGTEFIVDGAGGAAGVIRGNGPGLKGIIPDRNADEDRVVAVKITTAAATKAAGEMRVRLTYAAE